MAGAVCAGGRTAPMGGKKSRHRGGSNKNHADDWGTDQQNFLKPRPRATFALANPDGPQAWNEMTAEAREAASICKGENGEHSRNERKRNNLKFIAK